MSLNAKMRSMYINAAEILGQEKNQGVLAWAQKVSSVGLKIRIWKGCSNEWHLLIFYLKFGFWNSKINQGSLTALRKNTEIILWEAKLSLGLEESKSKVWIILQSR